MAATKSKKRVPQRIPCKGCFKAAPFRAGPILAGRGTGRWEGDTVLIDDPVSDCQHQKKTQENQWLRVDSVHGVSERLGTRFVFGGKPVPIRATIPDNPGSGSAGEAQREVSQCNRAMPGMAGFR